MYIFKLLSNTQSHVEPTDTPLMNPYTENNKKKYDYIKFKICTKNTSLTSDMYKYNVYMFKNGESEELLILVRNYKKTLD